MVIPHGCATHGYAGVDLTLISQYNTLTKDVIIVIRRTFADNGSHSILFRRLSFLRFIVSFVRQRLLANPLASQSGELYEDVAGTERHRDGALS